MRSFKARRYIAATPQEVWEVLTDTDRLTNGDFGIVEIEGKLAPRSIFKLREEVGPKQPISLTVSEFIPNKRMVWRSQLPFKILTRTRQFDLAEVYDGTDFNMRDDFSGLLARLIGKASPHIHPSFDKFADALKAQVESPSSSPAART